MPKSLNIDPKEVRRSYEIALNPIPVNSYRSDFSRELERYGREGLAAVYRDMVLIREFETMLDLIKREGSYRGISYNHRGPAHLSAGQESAAVGQCLSLGPEDFIFGSHRSHGEILAKCFSAVRKTSESQLETVMKGFMDGDVLRVVEHHFPADSLPSLAENFVLYGALAEIFARSTGFSRGLGGSMHTFFAPFGSMPNNAIVGGSGDIGVGAALFKKINRKPGIVISNIGDAAMACGPVWEGLMLAAMDQYRTLWGDMAGAPPYMLNVFNNFYGMGGQTFGETMGYGTPARAGCGVNADNLHAERVDGFNPLAVADAVLRKKKILLEGRGPVLMDTVTYRISGHSPSDASSYRSREELEAFRVQDPIVEFGRYLKENGVLSEDDLEHTAEEAAEKIRRTLELATDEKLSPHVSGAFIETVMFSDTVQPTMGEGEPQLLQKPEENERVRQIARKSRFYRDDKGNAVPAARLYVFRDAIFEAMIHGFTTDPTMIAYGEENRDWGGAFACYRGLTELLPYHRLFNSPM